MDPARLALARHHSYTLLGRLYLEGPQQELLPFVRALPELAGALPEGVDADLAAADHQTLWGFNLFPFESIFLDDSGLLGGEATGRVRQAYREAGFAGERPDTSADHIGLELLFLAFLCGAEADALDDGLPHVARRVREHQHHFLHYHLLRWLLPLTQAVGQHDAPFYRAASELTIALVAEHAAEGGGALPAWSLPPAPDLLADSKTGLREIAAYLTTPPLCGLFLSRDGIGALAREYALPRGFGSRQELLLTLLRTAAQYDALPALLTGLRRRLRLAMDEYDDRATHPALAPFVAPWRARLVESDALLEQLQAGAANLE